MTTQNRCNCDGWWLASGLVACLSLVASCASSPQAVQVSAPVAVGGKPTPSPTAPAAAKPPVADVQALSRSFTLPAEKLMARDLARAAFGPAQLTRTAVDGNVRFDFVGLDSSATGVGDQFPVERVYGQKLPSERNGDFSGFDGYTLKVSNAGKTAVYVSLYMNTGFASRRATADGKEAVEDRSNDTFWQSPWQRLEPGKSAELYLSFAHALAQNIADNKPPHTLGEDGQAAAINAVDQKEVTAIGLLVRTDKKADGSLLVTPYAAGAPAPGK